MIGWQTFALAEWIAQQSVDPCIDEDSFLCERVYDWTGSETAANAATLLLDKPLRILLIFIVAIAGTWLIKRVIRKGLSGVAKNNMTMKMAVSGEEANVPQIQARAKQRTETISTVLTSIAAALIWSIAAILILGELGINLAPLIAGAGIAGVALGFGAQSLVQDFIAGVFMVAEDQFGVGDIVDLGEAVGAVERVTLRTTVVRDIYGTVWHVPNGQIDRVGNKSQLWAVALVDIGVAYSADIDNATEILHSTAQIITEDPEWADLILEEPQVLGVQALDADAVTLRMSIKTEPAAQFAVQRELNRRIKEALDSAGIEIPYPQRTIWLRDDSAAVDPAGDKST